MLVKDILFEEEPISIIDPNVRKLRTKEIKFVKFKWMNRTIEEASLETEKDMWDKYP